MIRQSFVYDEQQGQLVPRPTDDSYRQQLEQEKRAAEQAQERREALEHPGIYL